MNEYDNYKQATPPDKSWYCDYCGCEIPDDKVSFIPTENRYVNYTACPECAKEEILKQNLIEADYENK